jgi:hypothetical protein
LKEFIRFAYIFEDKNKTQGGTWPPCSARR